MHNEGHLPERTSHAHPDCGPIPVSSEAMAVLQQKCDALAAQAREAVATAADAESAAAVVAIERDEAREEVRVCSVGKVGSTFCRV